MIELPIEEFKVKLAELPEEEAQAFLETSHTRFQNLSDSDKQKLVKDVMETIMCLMMQKGLGPVELDLIVNILLTPRMGKERNENFQRNTH